MKKTVFITGAYRGLGFATARELGKQGWRVILGCRSAESGQAAVDKLVAEKIDSALVIIDVSDRSSIQRAAQEVGRITPQLNLLVNNAAIYIDAERDLVTLPEDVIEKTLSTNLLGPIYLTRTLIPLLKKAKGARVINVSSGLGSLNADNGTMAPSYSISKTALNAVTKQFAAALKSDGIAVNSVCPGWVRTEMGGPNAPRSIEQGISGIVWLATEAPQTLTAGFFRDAEVIAW